MENLLNKITLGDSLEVIKRLPNKSIDMVLTDIPYGEVNRKSNGLRDLDRGVADTVDFDIKELIEELTRVTKGSIYIFCGTEQVSDIRKFLVAEGLSTRLIIWEKTNPSPMNGDKIWLSGIECCVYGKFSGATFNEHCKNTVLRYPVCSGKKRIHKTQKPLQMFEYLIKVSSNEGDLILDPFSGSATTAVACKRLNRNFICIEKGEQYFINSLIRLKEANNE